MAELQAQSIDSETLIIRCLFHQLVYVAVIATAFCPISKPVLPTNYFALVILCRSLVFLYTCFFPQRQVQMLVFI